jgi:hypothetical protein
VWKRYARTSPSGLASVWWWASYPTQLTGDPDRVAFLHIDLNNFPEQAVVRHFWPRLTLGGVFVYDDSGFVEHDASRRAADELSQELGFSILASPTGQGIVVKAPSSNRGA